MLAKNQSRFTRDMELVERYLHGKFPEWGIRFIAVVDHVDTGDANSKKARQINGLVNEWYLEDLSRNVRSVLTHKRQSGKYIGSFALYGYAKDPADHNHLVPDPEAAAVVRRIFGMVLSGYGATRIAKALNEEGIPNPTLYKQQQGLNFAPGQDSRVPGLIICDPEAEYYPLVERPKGQVIKVSQNSTQYINPMDITGSPT